MEAQQAIIYICNNMKLNLLKEHSEEIGN